MGMVLELHRVSDEEIAAMADDDERVEAFLDAIEAAEDDANGVDLDKAWHAIHFLLTGSADETKLPEGALLGGREVGDDLGYGPARVLTAAETRGFAKFVQAQDRSALMAKFDFAALGAADIYPSIWERHDPEDIDYVLSYAEDLRKFVDEAAAEGSGLFIIIM